MKRAWKLSIAGHGLILGALILGLPYWGQKKLQILDPIPIEIVTEGPHTAVPTPREKKDNTSAVLPHKPPLPTPAQEQEEIMIKPSVPAVEKKSKETQKDSGLKPTPPKISTTTVEKAQADISNILKDLQKQSPQTVSKSAEPAAPPAEVPRFSDQLNATEADALRAQLVSCWNFPMGARNAQDLVVEIVVEVNPDRTVHSVEIIDSARSLTDSFYRAAAESARRAVLKCQPLQLPPDKYSLWHKLTIEFNPKDLL